jgi:RimJ/RimL family protein N-acetyltransferase
VKADARGRGVASRAVALLARFAFDQLGAARVQLLTESDNVASQRVAEKAGFTREGTLRSFLDFKGRRRDAVMFSLLPGDGEGS